MARFGPLGNLSTGVRRAAAALAVCLIAGGALAACGGGSPTGSGVTLPGGVTLPSGVTLPGGGTQAGGGATTTTNALSALQSKIQAGENTTFEVTYKVLSGSSLGSTLTIAQSGGQLYYETTDTGGSQSAIIVTDSTTAYVCSLDSGSSAWQCMKYPASYASSLSAADEFYTAKFWTAEITTLESTEMALAGVHVANSSMTVNGIDLSCVTWSVSGSGSGANQSTEWCVTAQGILGYVNSTGSGSSGGFQIQSYSPNPTASLFQLPAGATVVTMPTGT